MLVIDGTGASASTSTALTILLPPLDCSAATFNPPILVSRSYGQTCAANKVRAESGARRVDTRWLLWRSA